MTVGELVLAGFRWLLSKKFYFSLVFVGRNIYIIGNVELISLALRTLYIAERRLEMSGIIRMLLPFQ